MTETKQVVIKLMAKPQFVVEVTLPDGTPVEGATVEIGSVLWELLPLKFVTRLRTDGAGQVYVRGMLPGGYLIQAYKEEENVQATPAQVSIDFLDKATPDKLKMALHAAPWFYTLKVKYPAVVGVLPAAIMGKMLEVEAKYLGAHFDEVRVVGESVEIDYHITQESPLVLTGSVITAIFVGLGLLILLGVVSWILIARFKPPAQKKKFPCPIPGCDESFTDQAGLATHLITVHSDPHPWMCAYEGCNLRFSTEAEKLAHMDQFHKKVMPWTRLAAILGGAYVLGKVLAGG